MGREILIVPDAQRADEELRRRLQLAAGGRAVVLSGAVMTLADLERDLYAACRRGRRRIGRIGRRLLLGRVAAGSGGPLRAIAGETGFHSALGDAISAAKQGLVSPGELQDAAAAYTGPGAPRLREVAALYAAYQRALDAAGLDDDDDARTAAAQVPGDLALPPELRGAQVVVQGILDFSPARTRLLVRLAGALAREGGGVTVRLPFDPERPELVAFVEPAWRAFEAYDGPGLELEPDPLAPEGHPLGDLLRALFRPGAEAEAAGLRVLSAPSPEAEAREAARLVRDRVAAGTPPGEIAVAYRGLGDRVPALGRALSEMGVPWRERRGPPLASAPPARIALAALELCATGFPREPLVQLLASRYVDGWAEGLPPHVVAGHLRAAGVRDAATLRARMERHAARLRQNNDDRRADEVLRALAHLEAFIAPLAAIPEETELAAFCASLLRVLDKLGVPRRSRRRESAASNPTPAAEAAGGDASAGSAPGSAETEGEDRLSRAAATALARDQAAVRALADLLAAIPEEARLAGLHGARFSRAAFAQLLRAACDEEALRPGGARGAAVEVLDIRELTGRRFRFVVLGGLNDGEFPARPPPDPLLGEEERRALNRLLGRPAFRVAAASEAERAPLPPRQAEDPLLFALALAAVARAPDPGSGDPQREGAALLWSRRDADGREAAASAFVEEALRAAPGCAQERAPLAPVALPETCRTPEELAARASLESLADPAFRASDLPDPETAAATIAAARAVARPLFERAAAVAAIERERLEFASGRRAPGRFSGLIARPDLRAALVERAYDGPLSAGRLEEYGTCPWKSFAKRALGLDREEEVGEDLESTENGTLLHRCAENAYRALQARALLPLRGRPEERATAMEAAEQVLAAWEAGGRVAHRGLWELRKEAARAAIEELLADDQKSGGPHVPRFFELKFGDSRAGAADVPPLAVPSEDGSEQVEVAGAIDRIDVDAAHGAAMVLDYKSGGKSFYQTKLQPDALGKTEFQMPLYLLAATGPAAAAPRADAAYVSLRDGARTKTLRAIADKAGFDVDAFLALEPRARAEAREARKPNLADAVWGVVRGIRGGTFPVSPADCKYCDFRSACRVTALATHETE